MFRFKKMKQKKNKQIKNQQNALQTKKICFQLRKKNNVASNNCSVNIKMQSQIHTT